MATKYLISCRCGEKNPVEPGRAGGTVVCKCGKKLDVPTLGRLKSFPLASAESVAVKGVWGNRQRLLVASTAIAILAGGVAIWFHLQIVRSPEKMIEAQFEYELKIQKARRQFEFEEFRQESAHWNALDTIAALRRAKEEGISAEPRPDDAKRGLLTRAELQRKYDVHPLRVQRQRDELWRLLTGSLAIISGAAAIFTLGLGRKRRAIDPQIKPARQKGKK
jgi:hypothetical protein